MDADFTIVDPFGAVIGGEINDLPAPLWIPWPVPSNWTFAGIGYTPAGRPESASTVGSWVGSDLFGDPIEVLFVCEEPGAVIGSHLAGLDTSYPSLGVGEGPPHARFGIDGHPVPLWSVEGGGQDRAAYAGEAAGRWLWVIVFPAEASTIMVEPLTLVDARHLGAELTVLPVGEMSLRLVVD